MATGCLVAMIEGIENPKRSYLNTGTRTGKTSLVHYFLNSLDEKVKAAFIFHTSISFRELLKNILWNWIWRLHRKKRRHL